jgi:hypothetical protein
MIDRFNKKSGTSHRYRWLWAAVPFRHMYPGNNAYSFYMGDSPLSIYLCGPTPLPHPHHHQYDLTDPFLYISYSKTGAAVSLCYEEKYSILFSKIHKTFLPWTKGQGRPVHFLLVTFVFLLKNKRPTHFSTSFSCHKSYNLCYKRCFFALTLQFFACTNIRLSVL